MKTIWILVGKRAQALPGLWVKFVKFCLVGGSGVVVDMAVLYVLADPSMLFWPVLLSKVLAAETAMVNNFIWNELWTFRETRNMAPFRCQGYFIGSGVVEAGYKTVVGARCKQSGMFWSPSGAENILALLHSQQPPLGSVLESTPQSPRRPQRLPGL